MGRGRGRSTTSLSLSLDLTRLRDHGGRGGGSHTPTQPPLSAVASLCLRRRRRRLSWPGSERTHTPDHGQPLVRPATTGPSLKKRGREGERRSNGTSGAAVPIARPRRPRPGRKTHLPGALLPANVRAASAEDKSTTRRDEGVTTPRRPQRVREPWAVPTRVENRAGRGRPRFEVAFPPLWQHTTAQ